MYDYMGEGGRGGREKLGIKGKGSCGETKADLEGFHVVLIASVYIYLVRNTYWSDVYICAYLQ